MLLFYCTTKKELDSIAKKGIKGPVSLFARLEEAESKCSDLILVIHAYKIKELKSEKKGKLVSASISPDAILNMDPYLPPSEVIAAGGYVIKDGKKEPEVLMIYRKGVWDLPKGKLDNGESIEECALREVREEVGIKKLVMKRELGNTVHGYAGKTKFKVKTTFWYQMETSERNFTPQAEESIEKVKWMPWSRAVTSIGYEIFRRHMVEIEGQLV